MAPEKKKTVCLDCDKEITLTDKGACPECGLRMSSILEIDRHERALKKLRKQRATESDEDETNDSPLGFGRF